MQARLVEFADLAEGVRHFVFEAIGTGRLNFIPGQFVSFTQEVDGKPITRAYSLASAPNGTNRFELCLNLVPGGRLTPFLFTLRPGDTLDATGPLGTFTMRAPARDSLLIATGTGITPFRSFLQAYLPAGTPRFTLLYGVRYESHLLYRAEFEELAREYPQFEFLPTVTRPTSAWTGLTGRVQAHLDAAIAGRREIDFYLCGLKEMVDQVRATLKDRGFDRRQIRVEKYD